MGHIPLQQPEAHLPHGYLLFLQLRALWEVLLSRPQSGREDAKIAELGDSAEKGPHCKEARVCERKQTNVES